MCSQLKLVYDSLPSTRLGCMNTDGINQMRLYMVMMLGTITCGTILAERHHSLARSLPRTFFPKGLPDCPNGTSQSFLVVFKNFILSYHGLKNFQFQKKDTVVGNVVGVG